MMESLDVPGGSLPNVLLKVVPMVAAESAMANWTREGVKGNLRFHQTHFSSGGHSKEDLIPVHSEMT